MLVFEFAHVHDGTVEVLSIDVVGQTSWAGEAFEVKYHGGVTGVILAMTLQIA